MRPNKRETVGVELVGTVLARQAAAADAAAVTKLAERAVGRLTHATVYGQPLQLLTESELRASAQALGLKLALLKGKRGQPLVSEPGAKGAALSGIDTLKLLVQRQCPSLHLQPVKWTLGADGLALRFDTVREHVEAEREKAFRNLLTGRDQFDTHPQSQLPKHNEAAWVELRKKRLWYSAAVRQYSNYLEWCTLTGRDREAADPQQHTDYRAHLRSEGKKVDRNSYLAILEFTLENGPPAKEDFKNEHRAKPKG
jgi:hypothetical protein